MKKRSLNDRGRLIGAQHVHEHAHEQTLEQAHEQAHEHSREHAQIDWATATCDDASGNEASSSDGSKIDVGQQALLAGLISNEIIPRLLLANPPELAVAAPTSNADRLAERVGELSELVVSSEGTVSTALFERLRAEGFSIEVLFQDLLAPTARRLGVLWHEDIYDFIEVTRGLGILQSLVQQYGSEFSAEAELPNSSRRALLMPVPGEQHTFGVSLLSEQFRNEGWRVWNGIPRHDDELNDLVSMQWFDLAGLSASVLEKPATLASAINGLRRASKNPNLIVFVGGLAFAKSPDLVTTVGADATAADAREAVRKLDEVFKSEASGFISKRTSPKQPAGKTK